MTKRGLWTLGAALVALAGCASSDEKKDLYVPKPACPQVAILVDARTANVWLPGQEGQPEGLVASAEMENFEGECKPGTAGETVPVSFDLHLVASKGPAFKSKPVTFNYFVAVLDGQDAILAKKVFDVPFVFEEGKSKAEATETVEPTLPIPAGMEAGSYRVLMGFQLSPNQLEENIKTREASLPAVVKMGKGK